MFGSMSANKMSAVEFETRKTTYRILFNVCFLDCHPQKLILVLQQSDLGEEGEDGLIGVEDDEVMEEDEEAEDNADKADGNESYASDDSESSDEDTELSSEDSGIDEDNNSEITNLKEKVKSALGDAADDDDDDDDSDESEAPDLSDSEMFKLDDVLAAAFRSMKKGKQAEKRGKKERQKQMVDFKSRVLDLVEVVVKHHPTVLIIKNLVLPLLEMMEEGVREKDRQTLANKATLVFKHLYGVKKIIPDTAADKEEIFTMFTQLVEYSSKVTMPRMVVEVAKGCLIVIRLLLNIQDNTGPSPLKTRARASQAVVEKKEAKLKDHDYYQEKVVSVIQDALTSLLHKKGRRLPVFFYTMIERYPLMFWPLSETLVTAAANDDVKVFLRTQACSMLSNLINAKTATEVGPDHWSDFLASLQTGVATILAGMDDNKPHFVRSLLCVLEKVAGVSIDACKQVLQADGIAKLQSLAPTVTKDTEGVFRQVMRKVNPEYYENKSPKKKKNKKRKHKDSDTVENTIDTPKKSKMFCPTSPGNIATVSTPDLKPLDTQTKPPDSPNKDQAESPELVMNASITNSLQVMTDSPKRKHKKNKKHRNSDGRVNVSQAITEAAANKTLNQSEENKNKILSEIQGKTEGTGDTLHEQVEGSAKKKHKHKRKKSLAGEMETSHIDAKDAVGSPKKPKLSYTPGQGSNRIATSPGNRPIESPARPLVSPSTTTFESPAVSKDDYTMSPREMEGSAKKEHKKKKRRKSTESRLDVSQRVTEDDGKDETVDRSKEIGNAVQSEAPVLINENKTTESPLQYQTEAMTGSGMKKHKHKRRSLDKNMDSSQVTVDDAVANVPSIDQPYDTNTTLEIKPESDGIKSPDHNLKERNSPASVTMSMKSSDIKQEATAVNRGKVDGQELIAFQNGVKIEIISKSEKPVTEETGDEQKHTVENGGVAESPKLGLKKANLVDTLGNIDGGKKVESPAVKNRRKSTARLPDNVSPRYTRSMVK